jgi:hypothetical protein
MRASNPGKLHILLTVAATERPPRRFYAEIAVLALFSCLVIAALWILP